MRTPNGLIFRLIPVYPIIECDKVVLELNKLLRLVPQKLVKKIIGDLAVF